MRAEAYVVRFEGAWFVRVTLFPPGLKPLALLKPFASHADAAAKVAELSRALELDPPEFLEESQRRSTA